MKGERNVLKRGRDIHFGGDKIRNILVGDKLCNILGATKFVTSWRRQNLKQCGGDKICNIYVATKFVTFWEIQLFCIAPKCGDNICLCGDNICNILGATKHLQHFGGAKVCNISGATKCVTFSWRQNL